MSEKEREALRQAMAIVENAKTDHANRLAEMKSPGWRISEEQALAYFRERRENIH
jgi:hypothetical protein